MKELKKLIDVKSIVTILLTGVFAYLSITKYISGEDFKLVFVMIMTYYFTRKNKEG
jgi:hypothetical protein